MNLDELIDHFDIDDQAVADALNRRAEYLATDSMLAALYGPPPSPDVMARRLVEHRVHQEVRHGRWCCADDRWGGEHPLDAGGRVYRVTGNASRGVIQVACQVCMNRAVEGIGSEFAHVWGSPLHRLLSRGTRNGLGYTTQEAELDDVECIGCDRTVVYSLFLRWQYVACCDVHRDAGRRRAARGDRPCPRCNTTFTPSRADQAYCSGACRQAAYRQRLRTSEVDQ